MIAALNKRPIPVTVTGCLLATAGFIGLLYHLPEFDPRHPLQADLLWVSAIRMIAVVCGLFILRGKNWARWLGLAWLAYHVVLSAFHSFGELAMHAVLLALLAWFLFRPAANRYFRSVRD